MQHASLKCLESKSLFWEAVSLLGTLFPPSRQGFFYWAMACDACISHATRQVVPVLVQKKNSKFQTWYTSCADDMWKRGKLLCCKRGIGCCCKKRIWSRHMESMQAVDWKAASSHKSQQRKTKHANHMLTIRKGTIFIWENCKYAMHWSLEVYGVLTRQFREKKKNLMPCTLHKHKGQRTCLDFGAWNGKFLVRIKLSPWISRSERLFCTSTTKKVRFIRTTNCIRLHRFTLIRECKWSTPLNGNQIHVQSSFSTKTEFRRASVCGLLEGQNWTVPNNQR